MSGRDAPSEYLKSSVISFFGEAKGREVLKLFQMSGITCFDDLAKGVPEGLADLAGVSLEQINDFLEEYGPQAIFRLKKKLVDAEKRIKELEVQVEWARKQLLSRKEATTSGRGRALGILRSCLARLNMLTEVIELNYEEDDLITETNALKRELLSIAEDIKGLSKDPSLQELSGDLIKVSRALTGLAEILEEVRSGDLRYAITTATSILSDVILSLTRGDRKECLQVLMENVFLKAELLSHKVDVLGGRMARPAL